jgi:hypothetical protein
LIIIKSFAALLSVLRANIPGIYFAVMLEKWVVTPLRVMIKPFPGYEILGVWTPYIKPYSQMKKDQKVIDYTLIGKGNKTRTIKINMQDLKALDTHYTTPYYQERKIKYKARYNKDCPPSILFLNKSGVPVTPEKILRPKVLMAPKSVPAVMPYIK